MAGSLGLGALGAATATACARGGNPPPAASSPSATGASGSQTCALTPEITEGPYYLSPATLRHDIAEARPGIPLVLRFQVTNSASCQPLSNVALDIWHCDTRGTYSGYAVPSANPPGPVPPKAGGAKPEGLTPHNTHVQPVNHESFLRGVQLTNQRGSVDFLTIYPGWYNFRAVHVHVKVHVGGTDKGAEYSGGHISHTGQFFMPNDYNDQIARLAPYSANPIARITNEEDLMYDQGGASATFAVSPLHPGKGPWQQYGLLAAGSMSVNPDATPPPK
jgi:protocatechuate 3,4-dioxygenase beta subunit